VIVGDRAALSMSTPLVPVPPRAAFWLGVAYRFGATATPPPARRAEAPLPPPPVIATIDGRVVAADGAALTAPHVTIQTGGDPVGVTVNVGGDGRFTFTGKPRQILTVRAQAADHEPATASVTLGDGAPRSVTLTLDRKLPSGQIRGLIRSFKGDGLDADVEIEPGDHARQTQTLHTKDGRFEADVAPGTYDVTITASGFETQRRHVEVEQNGVTLLNADLRGAR
jgi:hypothetical protein